MKRNTLTFWLSFCIFCLLSCQKSDRTLSVSLLTKDGKAIGVSIRDSGLTEREVINQLKIQLIKAGDRASVLGEFKIDGDEIIFEPLVPFTEGLEYAIMLGDSAVGEIRVPAGNYSPSELLSIYPTQDTLPENLLKLYFEFSQPMVEGRSLDHITLIRSDGDTMKGTFLDLQPELWNAEGTVLTLWLDPGRIKRDLIPNRQLGAPLAPKEKYSLSVSKQWRTKTGVSLLKDYQKNFITTIRDDISPALTNWKIIAPAAEASDPLEVNLTESLDYFLLKESFAVLRQNGDVVAGEIEINGEETILTFRPKIPWKAARYNIVVESKLEDLAGNNLNRPFDRDTGREVEETEQQTFIREFEIR